MIDRNNQSDSITDLEREETIKQLREALAESNSGKGLALEVVKQLVREKHGLAL